MLGKTAGGLYWMFRSLERAENTARLIEAGFRIALTRYRYRVRIALCHRDLCRAKRI